MGKSVKASQPFGSHNRHIGTPTGPRGEAYAPFSDKPGVPGGPLEAHDVFADNMTLEWKPPSDDGGVPVDHYTLEKFDTSTGHWVPAGRTSGSETNFKAEGLTQGKDYKFRVHAVNAEGESEPLETTQPITAKNPYGESE